MSLLLLMLALASITTGTACCGLRTRIRMHALLGTRSGWTRPQSRSSAARGRLS